MDINAILQQHGVTGLMLIVFTLVMWNTSRSNTQQLTASMMLINTIVAQREKDRDVEAANRKEDITRTEENFAQYESLVTTTAKNHALLAQNQTDSLALQTSSLALMNDMKSLLRIDAAAMQRVEIKQQASSEVLDKHSMRLEDIVNQLGDVMRTLNSLETKIDSLNTNAATKAEIIDIQKQIQELKLEVASLAKAISALQVNKQDKDES